MTPVTASTPARLPLPALLGGMVVTVLVLTAVFAPFLAPYGEGQIVSARPYAAPGAAHWLGTDQLGRDLLSRLIYGARNSMGIALLATALSFTLGTVLGMLAAVIGGLFEMVLSRAVDVVMSVPQLVGALIMLSIFGTSLVNLVLLVGFLGAANVYRLARSVAMDVATQDYVEDARVRGERLGWILTREILPNILPALVAEFGMRFCFVFLTISALSFLGLGIQPPSADWGSMVRENAGLIIYGDITPLLPASAIALLVISVNFVIDWFVQRYSRLRVDQ